MADWIPQREDKRGYINNPYWTESPQFPNRHSPCGYWPLLVASEIMEGPLYGAGLNSSYQLGISDGAERLVFTKTQHSGSFIKVSSGGSYTFALQQNGNLWCVGGNGYGQLGLGDKITRSEWVQVPGGWKDVACSPWYSHTLAVKKDGTLWTTGRNNYGQLGLNDEVDRDIFTQVGVSCGWTNVSCGSFYSMAIKNGALYATGDSYQGALGLGYGAGKEKEFQYVTSDVTSVDCGYYTTIILKGGSVWGTGSNADGQLGLGDTIARTSFTQVSLGGKNIHVCCGVGGIQAYNGVTFVIQKDGTMLATGSNLYNQMGIPDTSDRLNFVQIPGNWEFVSNKKNSTLAIQKSDTPEENGLMWGVGFNANGELGLGDKVPRTEFTKTGSGQWGFVSFGQFHAMAILYHIPTPIEIIESVLSPVWPMPT